MAEDQPGFLGRWARRKTDVRQGKPLDEPAVLVGKAPMATSPHLSSLANPGAAAEPIPQTPEPEKLLSLDDVKLLTQESDFSPFMARNVGSDVRNAAMKKLFTDPHYNVMDGLDIYISDYSIADPIPESMLRQMVGAKLLKIFDDEDDQVDGAGAAEKAPDHPVLSAEQASTDSAFPENLGADAAGDSSAGLESGLNGLTTNAVPPGLDASHESAAPAVPTLQKNAEPQEDLLPIGCQIAPLQMESGR